MHGSANDLHEMHSAFLSGGMEHCPNKLGGRDAGAGEGRGSHQLRGAGRVVDANMGPLKPTSIFAGGAQELQRKMQTRFLGAARCAFSADMK